MINFIPDNLHPHYARTKQNEKHYRAKREKIQNKYSQFVMLSGGEWNEPKSKHLPQF